MARAQCHSCGLRMTAERHGRHEYYRCLGTVRVEDRCRESYCRVDRAHTDVERVYYNLVLPAGIRNRLLRRATDESMQAIESGRRLEQSLKRQLAGYDRREAHLADLFANGLMSDDGHRLAQSRLQDARTTPENSLPPTPSAAIPVARLRVLLKRSVSAWEIHAVLPVSVQRELASLVFRTIRLSADGVKHYDLNHLLRCGRAA